MRRSTFDETRDQRIADEGGDYAERHLRCVAHGCPNAWSSDFGQRLCRYHAASGMHLWPMITREQQEAQTDRAIAADRTAGARASEPRRPTPQERAALTTLMHGLVAGRPTLAWAHALRDRERRGDRLSATQQDAWRAALRVPQGDPA